MPYPLNFIFLIRDQFITITVLDVELIVYCIWWWIYHSIETKM